MLSAVGAVDESFTALDPNATDYQSVLETYERSISRGRARLSATFGLSMEVESQGAWLRTSDGVELLNLGSYGTLFHGARHPYVEAQVIKQITTHPIASRLLIEPQQALAAQAVLSIAPEGIDHVYFTGSGTEATEAGLKLARTVGRNHIITMSGGYHGKTLGSLSVTANSFYQEPFQPLVPGVSVVEFGSIEALERELAGRQNACVILEPIQGEGGVVIPPTGYLTEVRSACNNHNAIMILDEIQTGLGRVGYWWAADREGVTPDILLAGKALSGGIVPVAAMLARSDVFDAFDRDPLIHTSTFAGAPIAMAAARASIEATGNDGLVEKANSLGALILNGLRHQADEICPHLIREVRGVGLLIGIETQAPGVAGALLSHLMDERVVINYSLNSSSVLRLTPPAILEEAELEFLFSAFHRALSRLAAEFPDIDSIGVW